MSDIVVAGLLVSASVFLLEVMLLPGKMLSPGAFWSVSRPVQSRLGEAVRVTSWLISQKAPMSESTPVSIAPLQAVAGGLGLLGGLVLSIAFPFALGRWFLPFVLSIACFQVPALLTRQRLAAQKRSVLRELPEIASLLQAFPHRNLVTALASITRTRHGLMAAIIKEALERNSTGLPLLEAMAEAAAGLKIEEVGRFVEVLAQVEATSTRSRELLRAYEQDLLSRRREMALRQVETAEGKISAVLTVATAMQLLLLLVVPSFLQFLAPGPATL